jgi:predicted  nucleic acid-binding Zn-ribbon protein
MHRSVCHQNTKAALKTIETAVAESPEAANRAVVDSVLDDHLGKSRTNLETPEERLTALSLQLATARQKYGNEAVPTTQIRREIAFVRSMQSDPKHVFPQLEEQNSEAEFVTEYVRQLRSRISELRSQEDELQKLMKEEIAKSREFQAQQIKDKNEPAKKARMRAAKNLKTNSP